MLSKGPHISIDSAGLVPRILRIAEQEFAGWPESVRRLTMELAEELFLVRYNPFISAETVRKSVNDRFELSRRGLAHHYATSISEGITMFWSAHESDTAFRKEIIARLSSFLPKEDIDASPYSLVADATDATDLRLELPLLVVTPKTPEAVSRIVRLANDMQFAIVPRGGGSGLTGGAVPARKRSVVLSLTKLTRIDPVDKENMSLTLEAGVITADAIKAADKEGFLFSVDPASNAASSIGGNVAENAGGPLCFEYGTTVDNLLSYRMVTPTGELMEIIRRDHPRHKILPDETAVFEVRDLSGGLRRVVALRSDELRTPGLGKDVTNKALGGLPGVQKEGTDGVILDATFVLHPKPVHFRVMVLEFFGRSMENCMLVVNDIVALRNDIRRRGDLVKISALEEFGNKYVQAIQYQKKSSVYEGDPISVLILQLDSDNAPALDEAVRHIERICDSYDGVDVFTAKDEKEAEHFWEDRHRLSAIAKRTSGFKINEDVVIPLQAIPDFALYLEGLNLEYAARAYRSALKKIENLPGLPEEDARVREELAYTTRVIQGEITSSDRSDQEMELHAVLMFRALAEDYPALADTIATVERCMLDSRVYAASHMHAGDGNWHVNIPTNSNDPEMLRNAEKIASLVMAKAQELGGEVTGEHGVGITKIRFLTPEKMEAFREFKNLVDPRNIFNPAKLTQRELPVSPFTFSFNRLIQDIRQSGLSDKERLIDLLSNVQFCTRCGKCRQYCPMYYPEQSLLYHPRNRNLALGALIEAIYYSQVNHGKPDPGLLAELRDMVEHCTGCGKCMAVCPVKVPSADVALDLRGFLEDEGGGGHPLKSRLLHFIAGNPATRIPKMAKAAAFGQSMQNKFLGLLPSAWTSRFENPAFSGPGPRPAYLNLMEVLHLEKGAFFCPQLPPEELAGPVGKIGAGASAASGDPAVSASGVKGTVLYFPGCGGSIFLRSIGLAAVSLLLRAGYAVILPEKHLCCGYALLAAGAHEDFAVNQDRNVTHLRALSHKAEEMGFPISHVLTSCGSCVEGLERHFLPQVFPKANGREVVLDDVAHFLFSRTSLVSEREHIPPAGLLYHAPCHAEVPGVHKAKAPGQYAAALEQFTGIAAAISPGCCGESGMGAITSPRIYNTIRAKKSTQLAEELTRLPDRAPIIVSCPSCKLGLQRILMQQHTRRKVLHTLEFLAQLTFGPKWTRLCKRLLNRPPDSRGWRVIPMGHSALRAERAAVDAADKIA